jgi:hypothetical protein
MGAILSLPISLLNFLLPFTKPGTPITQDLIHTAVLCGTLYYAPQIAEWYNAQQAGNTTNSHEQGEDTQQHAANAEAQAEQAEPLLDENLVLQNDDNDGHADRPPLAPTPPNQAEHHQPPAPHVQDIPEQAEAEAGPANDRPRPTPQNRAVGAKKAKSLARKDQRRAYHEFHRQEAELRRLQEAEGAEEREAALAAEKARRARIEAEIAERERAEREERKREVEKEQAEEAERRERVVQTVRQSVEDTGCVNLVDVAWAEGKDRVWVERLVRASGLLAQLQRDGAHAVITSQAWLVRVDAQLMQRAYAEAEAFGSKNAGKVSFAEFGSILEKVVLARAET